MDRRWTLLLPTLFITYSLSYLDRANFGFGAAAGMAADLKITSGQTSLLASLFFLGYFCFQIPGGIYAQRYSAKRLIFVGLIGWGLLASAMGLIRDIHLLYIDRFLLGVVESAVLPAMLVLQTRWYTRSERARANAFLILGNPVTMLWMSIVSGYLVAKAGWQMMFVFEGLPPLLWAFIWRRVVTDRPCDSAWLLPGAGNALEAALIEEQRNIKPITDHTAVFRSRRVLLLAAQYFLWSVGIAGFVMWMPSMLKLSDMSMGELGIIAGAPYLVAIIAQISFAFWSDLTGRRMHIVWPCLLLAAVAFYGSYFAGTHFLINFVLLIIAGAAMYAPYGPYFAYIAEILPANVMGGGIALINSLGSLGAFIGAYGVGVLNGATGSSKASCLMMAVALVFAAMLTYLATKAVDRY